MAFVSYAQNFEDVMLARALSGVERGFYIDVGAQDPEDDSVTKHFYDKGWRGLNFEPSDHYFARLEAERPRDLNLRQAVGDRTGTVTFYEEEGTGLSTIVEGMSGAARVERRVEMTTLDAVCAAHHVGIIHFLKIDVEGAEELVLRGMGLEKWRPWIILLEATKPNSPEPYYEHWEPLLTGRGYDFVYADGLNRFYLAREQQALAEKFSNPPNHFDGFVRASEVKADKRAEARWAEKLDHHLGIINRLGEDRAAQQSALEEHAARIASMAEQLDAQQSENLRLTNLLGESSKRVEALSIDVAERRSEIAELQTRLAELEAQLAHRAGQVAFREAKIAWLTLDRDRFREAHRRIVASPIWRLTAPLHNRRLRAATTALTRRPYRPAESSPAQVAPSAAVELPETALWIARRLPGKA